MCYRPDFESAEDYLDKTLLELLKAWHDYLSCWLDEEEFQKMNWLDGFCSDMREALIRLKDTPMLKEAIGQVQESTDNKDMQ